MGNNRKLKSDGFIFKILELITYIFYVVIGFYLAFFIRFGMNPSPRNVDPYIKSIPYIIITSIIVFYIYEITATFKKSLYENAVIIGLSLIFIDTVTIVIVFLNRGFAFPRSVFLIGFVVQYLLIFISKSILLKVWKSNVKGEDALIIASKEEAKYIAKKLLLDKYSGDKIKYVCDKVDKNTNNLIKKVDRVYIGSSLSHEDKSRIVNHCSENSKDIYLIPSLFELSLVDYKVRQADDLLMFKLNNLGLTFEQRFMKRLMDIIIAAIGLVITSPILIIISIVIKLYDRGPILFKQERVTENGKTFNLYKFRTMIVDAEKHTGPVLATDKDPRITPLGGFLRASRIDELPQLFNVLKGDMSMVGPRPERPFFVDQFNQEVDEFKYRTFVKAGITGLAQILGTYSTDPKTKAQYDLLYIRNYSLFLDVKIMFNTVRIMFMKSSSQGVKTEEKIHEIFEEFDLNIYEELEAASANDD